MLILIKSSAELLRLRQQLSKGSLNNSNNTKVKLKLEDGSLPIQSKGNLLSLTLL